MAITDGWPDALVHLCQQTDLPHLIMANLTPCCFEKYFMYCCLCHDYSLMVIPGFPVFKGSSYSLSLLYLFQILTFSQSWAGFSWTGVKFSLLCRIMAFWRQS